jgi:glutamate racemase
MERSHAIGVLDSGVGGLTVASEIFRTLPNERIVYFGDTARMPYGPRPHEQVRSFVRQIIRFLETQDVKVIVVACNSATAAGLSYYQEEFTLPVIGVIEPGVRAAIRHTKSKRVGVIGTAGTIASRAYEEALGRLDSGIKVFSQACPLFVLLVENELTDTPEALRVAEEYLRPMRQAGVDTLILGCTHYPLLTGVLAKVLGPEVRLISSAEETARDTSELLRRENIEREPGGEVRHRFFVSGQPAQFAAVGSKLLSRPLDAYQVVWP